MRGFTRRGLAVLSTVLLMTAGASNPVSATLGFQGCGVSNSAISVFINSLINPSGDEYRFDLTDSTPDLDGTQDKVELYSAASAEKILSDSYSTAMDNYLSDTESVARMKAQVTVAGTYGDDKTKEQTRIDARQAIADHYAVKQKNGIVRWNATVSVVEVSIEECSESEPINNSTLVTEDDSTQVDSGSGWSVSKTYEGLNTSSVTLVNGSPADVLTYNYTIGDGYDSVNTYETYYVTPARHEWLQIDENFGWGFRGQEIAIPNDNHGPMTFIEHQSFADRQVRYETRNDGLRAEASNSVSTTYDDPVAGNVSSFDVISASTTMFEYSAQSGSDLTSLYDSTAVLALMGFDISDMQSFRLMNVTDQSGTTDVTCQGLVLVHSAPSESWSANTVYSVSAIDGPIFIVTVTGEKVDLNGTFAIIEITVRDRSSVQSQSTTQYVYKTTNMSEFVNMMNELKSLRQDIEEQEQSNGGSGDSGGLDSQTLGIALLVDAATVLLTQREGNEQDAPLVPEAVAHQGHRRHDRTRWCSTTRGHRPRRDGLGPATRPARRIRLVG